MTDEWSNHLWQSTWFAVAVGLLTMVFRKNRAQVRYWLWLSASIKFLLPFSMLMSLGSHLNWAPAARKISAPAAWFAMAQIGGPFPVSLQPALPLRGTTDWIRILVAGVWACGFAGVALIRFRGWLRIRAEVRSGTRMDMPVAVEVRSGGLREPGVVGLFRPILLLPAGIAERLTPPQLEAVLAHELCHVRRHDNLTSAMHMIVEAVFWFHPLVWWIGARLLEERERACDEEVLRLGSEPQVYAEGILNVYKVYLESPLRCLSGVTGSDLKKRIEAIMTHHSVPELNFARKAALAAAAIAALAAPVIVGVVNAPHLRAQSPSPVQSESAAAQERNFAIRAASLSLPADSGTGAGTGTRPKFEGVSIQPCEAEGAPAGRGGRGRVGPPPGSFAECATLADYIRGAYVFYPDGEMHIVPSNAVPIEGGPAWVHSDRYQIQAKAPADASREMMKGPMMQGLLEDRFQLKIHRESREGPAYALTVAVGGPKLPPYNAESCTPIERLTGPPAPGQEVCDLMDLNGFSLDEFSGIYLAAVMERLVVNRTGITGRFDLRLQFATPRNPAGPSIFIALPQQLGLKLEPATAPRPFMVIDSVKKPSGN